MTHTFEVEKNTAHSLLDCNQRFNAVQGPWSQLHVLDMNMSDHFEMNHSICRLKSLQDESFGDFDILLNKLRQLPCIYN